MHDNSGIGKRRETKPRFCSKLPKQFLVSAIIAFFTFAFDSSPGIGLFQTISFSFAFLFALEGVRSLAKGGSRSCLCHFAKALENLLLLLKLAFLMLIMLAAVEYAVPRLPGMNSGIMPRPVQPYIFNGDWYQGLGEAEMLYREGPSAYGYERNGMTYVFSFEYLVASVSERFKYVLDRPGYIGRRAPDDILILVVGGSVAQGTGAGGTNAYFTMLSQLLTTSCKRTVRVLPLAMGAFVSAQERIMLDLVGWGLNPDAVIILDGYNDIAQPLASGSRPGDPYNLGFRYREMYNRSVLDIFRRSKALMCIENRIMESEIVAYRQGIVEDPVKRANYKNSVVCTYYENLKWMVAQCQLRRIPCLVFLQPCEASSKARRSSTLNSTEQLVFESYSELEALVRARGDLPFVSGTGVFDSLEILPFYDPVHFGAVGHARLAEELCKFLQPLLKTITADRE